MLSSPITRQVVVGGSVLYMVSPSTTQNIFIGTQISQNAELLSSTNSEADFMLESTQTFELDGFAPSEHVCGITFETVSLSEELCQLLLIIAEKLKANLPFPSTFLSVQSLFSLLETVKPVTLKEVLFSWRSAGTLRSLRI